MQNFVSYKFGHLPQKDWQTMYDLARMFLHCLNYWKMETPSSRKQTMSADEIATYKVKFDNFTKGHHVYHLHIHILHHPFHQKTTFQVNYTRWLCYCHVPAFCDSLPHYEISLIFGKTLLKSVFQVRIHTTINCQAVQNVTLGKAL